MDELFERDSGYEDESNIDERKASDREGVDAQLDLPILLERLESYGSKHSSYYHYTQWTSLEKMLQGVSSGPARGNRLLLLTKAINTNDKIEQGWGKNVFLACFSYSRYESVAMWANYGKRSPEAVMIRFDGNAIRDWMPADKSDCELFAVSEKNGAFCYKKINPEDVESVKLVDVAYVLPERMARGRRMWGNVEYSRRFYRVPGEDGTLEWSDAIYEGRQDETRRKLLPYFKKRGWSYERETRLIVTLKDKDTNIERVAVEFNGPFAKLAAELKYNPERAVVTGPWYDVLKSPKSKIEGVGLNQVGKSDYVNEVNLLDKCAKCPLDATGKAHVVSSKSSEDVVVFACADIHRCNIDDLRPEGADIAIIAGDMQGDGSCPSLNPPKSWVEQQIDWVNRKLMPWCRQYPNTQFVIVAGNCDEFALDKNNPLCNLGSESNVHYLQDSMIEIKGVKIWGTPWVKPKHHRKNGPYKVFEKPSAELRKLYGKMPEGIDILVSHSTPCVEGSYIAGDPRENFGNEELTKAILAKRPRYCVCGHIHAKDHAPARVGDTIVMNVSLIRHSRYAAEYAPSIFTISGQSDEQIGEMAFLDEVAQNLAFVVQRVNRNIFKGSPGPGANAGKGFSSIDYRRLCALAKKMPTGRAGFLKLVYDEVKVSENAKWGKYILASFWRPDFYDGNHPWFSTNFAQWYFASPLATRSGLHP
ncbi:MAG: metallophosphoesterase [Kiritimatiellae bacterium]|nr:metallophosphoesterase [Kiritimatiellia bacterium]